MKPYKQFWRIFLLFFIFLISINMLLLNSMDQSTVFSKGAVRAARITRFEGNVILMRAGGEREFRVFIGMSINEGDSLITGKGSWADLDMDDDKDIRIGEYTQIRMNELRGTKGDDDQTSIILWAGEIWNSIKDKLSPDAKYEIRTPTTVMAVRGTKFHVKQSFKGTELIVLEGKVSVTLVRNVAMPDGSVEQGQTDTLVLNNEKVIVNQTIQKASEINHQKLIPEDLDMMVLESIKKDPQGIDPDLLKGIDDEIKRKQLSHDKIVIKSNDSKVVYAPEVEMPLSAVLPANTPVLDSTPTPVPANNVHRRFAIQTNIPKANDSNISVIEPTHPPVPGADPINQSTWTPTVLPTETPTATMMQTNTPTATPTPLPTFTWTNTPTSTPTPTPLPTQNISSNQQTKPITGSVPTQTPTNTPTATSTFTPTDRPTNTPTNTPTITPTDTPTFTPTVTPTDTPTPQPAIELAGLNPQPGPMPYSIQFVTNPATEDTICRYMLLYDSDWNRVIPYENENVQDFINRFESENSLVRTVNTHEFRDFSYSESGDYIDLQYQPDSTYYSSSILIVLINIDGNIKEYAYLDLSDSDINIIPS